MFFELIQEIENNLDLEFYFTFFFLSKLYWIGICSEIRKISGEVSSLKFYSGVVGVTVISAIPVVNFITATMGSFVYAVLFILNRKHQEKINE